MPRDKNTIDFLDMPQYVRVAACFGETCIRHDGKLYRMVQPSTDDQQSQWIVEPNDDVITGPA